MSDGAKCSFRFIRYSGVQSFFLLVDHVYARACALQMIEEITKKNCAIRFFFSYMYLQSLWIALENVRKVSIAINFNRLKCNTRKVNQKWKKKIRYWIKKEPSEQIHWHFNFSFEMLSISILFWFLNSCTNREEESECGKVNRLFFMCGSNQESKTAYIFSFHIFTWPAFFTAIKITIEVW